MPRDFEKNVIACLLAAMGLCMLAAAFCRHLAPELHPATLSAAAGCLTWLASLGMARAAGLGLHTRVSFIEDLVSPQAKRRLNTVADIVFILFSAVSLLAGCAAIWVSSSKQYQPHGHILIYVAIPFGSALTIVRLVQRIRARWEDASA